MKIAVLGAGAWGTALAIQLGQRHEVALWARDPAQCGELSRSRCNQRYLPGFVFPDGVQVAAAIDAALVGADLAIIGATVAGLRPTLQALSSTASSLPAVWLCKGFEAGTARLPHQVAAEELAPGVPRGVLSGPSFALEVARGMPAAVTLACSDAGFSIDTARALHGGRLRIYSSDDITGVEVGGAVKNVMAIAAGISDGLGFGESARAALITRGLAEITRLGMRLGGRLETFMGLSGAGDLVLTCTSDLSRNRQVGLRLATGKRLESILSELGHVAEGVYTVREVHRLAQETGADMPIVEAVFQVLYTGLAPLKAVEMLMTREPKPEHRG